MIIISKEEQSKSKKKMVEIYRININKLDYFDLAKEKKAAKKENRELVIRQSSNIVYYSNKKSQEAVIKIAESELLRIIRVLEGKKENERLESIISVKVGKNRERYKILINSGYVRPILILLMVEILNLIKV